MTNLHQLNMFSLMKFFFEMKIRDLKKPKALILHRIKNNLPFVPVFSKSFELINSSLNILRES